MTKWREAFSASLYIDHTPLAPPRNHDTFNDSHFPPPGNQEEIGGLGDGVDLTGTL